MARRGRTSVVYQVSQAINEINRIGTSKRDARATGDHGLHSTNAVKSALSVSQNFVKWAKQERNVRNIYKDLKPEHYQGYIDHKRSEGVSNGHLINLETGLRHLQKGMNAVSGRFGLSSNVFIPDKRIVSSTEREGPRNRSYTVREIERMKESTRSEKAQNAMEISQKCGLRLREIANVRVEHVARDGSKIVFADHNSKGVTKGGRPRTIDVPREYQDKLVRMVEGKQEHERVIGLSRGGIRKAIERAADKCEVKHEGAHGFRHAYARNLFAERLEQTSMGAERGREVFERMMDNRENGLPANDGISQVEYEEVKSCMDYCHDQLGHGKDRFDLAEVYLR